MRGTRLLMVLLAVLLVGVWCGAGRGYAGTDASRLTSTATTNVLAVESITRADPGGTVIGLTLAQPASLAEVRSLGSELQGDLIALWRTDYAMVRPFTFGRPDWEPEPSRFSYVEPAKIRERRADAIARGWSSPTTGGLIYDSYYAHWGDQWAKAQELGVRFEALAIYLRESAIGAARGDPRFRGMVAVPYHRSDSLSPDYLGEPFLDSEDFPPDSSVFLDVPGSHPYHEAIVDLADRRVVAGYTNGNFGPDDPVMRQQFAKMIVLSLELPVSPSDTCPFSDVGATEGEALYPDHYIAVAARYGITNGTSPGAFSPALYISRAQVVTMIVKGAVTTWPGVLGNPPAGWTGTLPAFDPTHGPTMSIAEYDGLLAGSVGFGRDWDPWAPASRGEVAQMLANLNKIRMSAVR